MMPTLARITERWSILVEATGMELSATLLVDGTLVSGFLTAPLRYHEWAESSVAICREMGNGGQDNASHPATPAELSRIRALWEEEHGGEIIDYSPTEICLRDASVTNAAGATFLFPYLLISAASVDAMTLGALDTRHPVEAS